MDRRIVVAGAGMVGNRIVTELVRRGVAGAGTTTELVLVGEERHAPYDRVHLSSYVEGASPDDLSLVEADVAPHVVSRLGPGWSPSTPARAPSPCPTAAR